MFKDAFIKLDSAQAQKMTQMVNPFLDKPLDDKKTTVMVHDLSFYKDYFLVDLTRHDIHPAVTRMAICNKAGNVYILNWTNEVIFKLNKTIPIHLNEKNMLDYIHFFFSNVKGKHGRFLIIDSVDDIEWRDEPAPSGRKALAKMIFPLSLKSKESDGTNIFKACIIFKDSLFQTEIYLKSDGHIILKNEELLVEDIPVADDVFEQ